MRHQGVVKDLLPSMRQPHKPGEGFQSSRASVGRKKKAPINQGLIVRTDYYIPSNPARTPASAGCRVLRGIFNERLSCPVFVTEAVHLARAPPTFSAGLPLLDTCCCSYFGTGPEDYINQGRNESMRRGGGGIVSERRPSDDCYLSQINCFIADMNESFYVVHLFWHQLT